MDPARESAYSKGCSPLSIKIIDTPGSKVQTIHANDALWQLSSHLRHR